MKNFNTELIIGLFMIAGFLAFGYLSLQMGEFSIFDLEKNYSLEAEFDNVSGLKVGAGIETAGVSIGKVARVALGENGLARVTMLIYIKIIQGADEEMLGEGDLIFDTESSIDFEELVSKYIFKSD
jgi:phospholipid/cholesterol/gamma-HCH transport system substrate-binding protein